MSSHDAKHVGTNEGDALTMNRAQSALGWCLQLFAPDCHLLAKAQVVEENG